MAFDTTALSRMQSLLDAPGLSSIALNGGAITVSDDTNDPNGPFRALWVGVAGNVKLTTIGGTAITLTNVPVGILPVGCRYVWSTGTTVTTPNTNIVGLK